MINELSIVALTKGIPSYKLEPGDVGTVVHVYGDGKAYEVEFITNKGNTIAVLSLKKGEIRKTEGHEESMHVRELEAS